MTPSAQANHRLIHWLQSNPPAQIELFPRPDNYEDARAYIKELAQQFGMMFDELAREYADNMPMKVDVRECSSAIQTAVEETDLFCSLYEAAEITRQDQLEAAE